MTPKRQRDDPHGRTLANAAHSIVAPGAAARSGTPARAKSATAWRSAAATSASPCCATSRARASGSARGGSARALPARNMERAEVDIIFARLMRDDEELMA
jgi:hypothetical protein